MRVLFLLLLCLPAFAQDFYDEDVPGQELKDDIAPSPPQIIYVPQDCQIVGPSLEIEELIENELKKESL